MSETELHETLKLVGWALLIKKGCSPVGVEISLPTFEHNTFEPFNQYKIADAVGLAWHYTEKETGSFQRNRVRTIYSIEAKASRNDFRKGFCNRGFGKAWIVSTPDTVPVNELPSYIGLYEFDPDVCKVQLKSKSSFTGYEPSEYMLKRMERDILWSGYGWHIHYRMNSNPIFRKLFGKITLDEFLENGEGAQVHKPEEPEERP